MQKYAQAPSTGLPKLKALLSRPSRESLDCIAKVLELTAELHKIPFAHKNKLPGQILELSKVLTEERGELARPYWSSPGFFSAYLYYFLPWNLYRLAWLLPNLDLGLLPESRILDLGSGPLTLPLALWCARPDLRSLPLHFVCTDIVMQPMKSGKRILESLIGGQINWRISLYKSPLEKALSAAPAASYDCILAGNVLNELADERSTRGGSTLEQKLDKFMRKAAAATASQGRLFLLEPGTRLGGKLISLARGCALGTGFSPLAPCTHNGPCPALGKNDDSSRTRSEAQYSGWCHFTFPALHVPERLVQLSRQAKLEKQSLALSCLLLASPARTLEKGKESTVITGDNDFEGFDELAELDALYAEILNEDNLMATRAAKAPDKGNESAKTHLLGRNMNNTQRDSFGARVISGPIILDGMAQSARYVCCEKGLGLLLDGADFPSGSLVLAKAPDSKATSRQEDEKQRGHSPDPAISLKTPPRPARDTRSGAIFLVPVVSRSHKSIGTNRGTEPMQNEKVKNKERKQNPPAFTRSEKTQQTRHETKGPLKTGQKKGNRKDER